MPLHERAYPFLADTDATGQKFLPHAWPAIFALDLDMEGLDVRQQCVVTDAVATRLAAIIGGKPQRMLVVATCAQIKLLAQRR